MLPLVRLSFHKNRPCYTIRINVIVHTIIIIRITLYYIVRCFDVYHSPDSHILLIYYIGFVEPQLIYKVPITDTPRLNHLFPVFIHKRITFPLSCVHCIHYELDFIYTCMERLLFIYTDALNNISQSNVLSLFPFLLFVKLIFLRTYLMWSIDEKLLPRMI